MHKTNVSLRFPLVELLAWSSWVRPVYGYISTTNGHTALEGCSNMSISAKEVERLIFHVEIKMYKVAGYVQSKAELCATNCTGNAWFEATCSQIGAEIDPDAFTPRQFTFLPSNLFEIIKSIWNIHAPSRCIHKISFVSFTVHNAGDIVGSLSVVILCFIALSTRLILVPSKS